MKYKEDILAKWLIGEISDAELEASEGVDALHELKKVTKEIDQWSMPKYNADAGFQKMKEQLQDKDQKKQKSQWLKFIGILFVIGLLLYGLVSFFGNQKEELKAEPGEHLHYAFRDGSEVWLNDGSNIEYKTTDWSTERSIELQGEALFEVNKGSPFIVHTPNGTITVFGTRFNVRAWGANLYVECYEGKVQVQSGNQLTVINAKEAVNIIDRSMNANQAISNVTPAWLNGMSRFYEEKLSSVFNELERQYKINVKLKSNDRIFSGRIRHDDLDQALRSICIPLNLSYTISQDKKSVVIE